MHFLFSFLFNRDNSIITCDWLPACLLDAAMNRDHSIITCDWLPACLSDAAMNHDYSIIITCDSLPACLPDAAMNCDHSNITVIYLWLVACDAAMNRDHSIITCAHCSTDEALFEDVFEARSQVESFGTTSDRDEKSGDRQLPTVHQHCPHFGWVAHVVHTHVLKWTPSTDDGWLNCTLHVFTGKFSS